MKVKEIVYMVLDLAKAATSDDAYYTEEHVLFLCKKYRAFLIKKEQEKNKGTVDAVSEFEYQQVCLNMEAVPAIDGSPCTGGYYLRSKEEIPELLEGYTPRLYPQDYYQGTHISYVSRDRMRYVGSNPYMGNIIYASLGPDLHLYMKGNNPQFLYLNQVRMAGVFDDFEYVQSLQCGEGEQSQVCDVLDMEFPIRDYLVPPLIELVVKEITGGKYQVSDSRNNGRDDSEMVNSAASRAD